MPFYGESEYEMDSKALNEELVCGEECPAVLREVIGAMTRKEWKERIGIGEALEMLKTK